MVLPDRSGREKEYMKKPTKSQLKKKAIEAFQRYIRSYGFCQAKGKNKVKCGGSLQCCHIIERSSLPNLFQEMNVLCMCAGHHIYFDRHRFAFIEFLLTYYPEKFKFAQDHWGDKREIKKEEYAQIIETYRLALTSLYR